jgi:peroxiredoxin Q/BCP
LSVDAVRPAFNKGEEQHQIHPSKQRNAIMSFLSKWVLALAAGLGLSTAAGTAAEALKAGDPAPDFSLAGSDGKTHKLSDYKGKQAVVIAWFPKAFTGGCTAECKSMRASGAEIRKFDVAYFTASCDDAETNKKFAESLGLDFPILSDPTRATAQAYGVVTGDAKNAKRWTFYVGKDGKILYVDQAVKTAAHGTDIAAKLKELGVATK